MRLPTTPLPVIVAAALIAGCGSEDIPEAEAAAHEAVEAAGDQARALQRASRRALDEVGVELVELRARVERAAEEGEQSLAASLDELTRRYEQLERRVDGLTEPGGDLDVSRDAIRQQLASLEHDLEMARLEARETQEEYTLYVAERVDRLQREIRGLQSALSTQAGAVDEEIRQGLREADSTVQELEREVAALQDASADEFREVRAEISTKVAELRSELRELELELSG